MSNTTKISRALSLSQFAEQLGIHRATLHMYVKSGRLRPTRIGHYYVVDEAEQTRFAAWLATRIAARPGDFRLAHTIRNGKLIRR